MANTKSILEDGHEGLVVDIECHLSKSLPNIVIVGFANKSVDEAKERIRGAIASSNLQLPKKRITLNLAPADVPKQGSSFDLPMIASILMSSKMVKTVLPPTTAVIGEVGLDGTIRPVRGVIGKILAGKKHGIDTFWIPHGNLEQAKLIPDINIVAFKDVSQLYRVLSGEEPAAVIKTDDRIPQLKNNSSVSVTFDDVVGQDQAKRALLIAAAGHHNIMLNGAPGTGKSMLAKAMPSIMPELSKKEMLDVTHLHSLANKHFDRIVNERPFRAPHHSASPVSILGGGQNPRPGEISLSHNGILFFDEFPEFSRSVIEALRQPLEDKLISVARAKDTAQFPAHFLLIATSNPCPCGYYGSQKECTCMPAHILKYQKKLSGPIIDRIDLYVEVEEVPHDKLLKKNTGDIQTKEFKKKISKARQRQIERKNVLNSDITNKDLKDIAVLSPETEELLNQAAGKMQLSARGYIRALRVARTIADLEDSSHIQIPHISEALQYRKKVAYL